MVQVSGSASRGAWSLGKLCVDWDNDNSLLWECDLQLVDADKETKETYNMECIVNTEATATCNAVINKFNGA